jgi:hypothetical protein
MVHHREQGGCTVKRFLRTVGAALCLLVPLSGLVTAPAKVSAAICTISTTADGRPYLAPTATGPGTGKKVGFDNTHGQTAGNADWVIDGGFSDMACALAGQGYTVEEMRTYPLTTTALNAYQVVVVAEPNIPFTTAEQQALQSYVTGGGGLLLVGDHYQADRNYNTWDATEVFNGYRRGRYGTTFTSPRYNYNGLTTTSTYTFNSGTDWLATAFGIRFRFNAMDLVDATNNPFKPGSPTDATDPGILPASQTFNITTGVTAVATYAGATISIVDPTKAMGLIYPNKNSLKRWGSAQSTDPVALYTDTVGTPAGGSATYGGIHEGAYVAVAKPSAGKVAAAGDSSLWEDATPKYKREDNGNTKTTHAGWTDRSHGTLGINVVNWLATPDATVGIPTALQQSATQEPYNVTTISEPLTEPWAQPPAGYLWYDATTFKTGAYKGGTSGGGGGTGKLVINEVLYDTPGDDAIEEWVELYNGTASAINLSGYKLVDNATTYTLPSITIPAGGFLTIASNSAGFSSLYGFAPNVSGMTLALGNSGDRLTLQNASGTALDMVAWENYVSGWGLNAATGQSIYRKSRTTDTDVAADWMVGAPTPGL